MKDLYSFCKDEKEQKEFYEKAKKSYEKIFKNIGLGEKTYTTYASGGTFSKYSDEFQTISDAGEDTIHVCQKCHLAVNEEIFGETKSCPSCSNKNLEIKKSIEVGNIFNLGTKFSESIGLYYTDEKGERKPVFMGSYGIGLGRVMGTVVEVLSDEKGIVWPKNIAPFKVHLIEINNKKKQEVSDLTEKIKKDIEEFNIEVLHDDREVTAGEKFADSDLIGIPLRVIVSEKSLGQDNFETKERATGETKQMTVEEIKKYFN
jgi:prolyl-tRNA synthetase